MTFIQQAADNWPPPDRGAARRAGRTYGVHARGVFATRRTVRREESGHCRTARAG